jgi:hypothetical protein
MHEGLNYFWNKNNSPANGSSNGDHQDCSSRHILDGLCFRVNLQKKPIREDLDGSIKNFSCQYHTATNHHRNPFPGTDTKKPAADNHQDSEKQLNSKIMMAFDEGQDSAKCKSETSHSASNTEIAVSQNCITNLRLNNLGVR